MIVRPILFAYIIADSPENRRMLWGVASRITNPRTAFYLHRKNCTLYVYEGPHDLVRREYVGNMP